MPNLKLVDVVCANGLYCKGKVVNFSATHPVSRHRCIEISCSGHIKYFSSVNVHGRHYGIDYRALWVTHDDLISR